MRAYPDGLVSERPAWTTPAGLAGILSERLGMLGRRLSTALLDVAAVGLLWVLVSYIYVWYTTGEIAYTAVPWWVFGLCVVELGALWQAFGSSLGRKMARKQLLTKDGTAPRFSQRLIYFLAWHISVVPLCGLLWEPAWHERLSGIRTGEVKSEGVKPPPWYRTTAGLYVAALLAAIVVAAVGVTITWTNLQRLFGEAWRTLRFWRALVKPDSSILVVSVQDLIVTVYMAVLATAFAVLAAVPLSFMSARNLMRGPAGRLTYTVLRGGLSIMRSIEPIVWAIVFLVWVAARRAPLAGVLALWVHSIADLTKLYAERLESIDPGLPEAITATGGGRLAVLRYGVLPQIINPYISFTLYRWDINIRMATVVGVVGGGGIGQRLYAYLQGHHWSKAGTVMLLIVVLVWAIDYLSSRLRAKLA
ncbi:MAG: phosphonate ABC transporter, permease protein PhnE [Candidatus Bipolaricaulota bacterium]